MKLAGATDAPRKKSPKMKLTDTLRLIPLLLVPAMAAVPAAAVTPRTDNLGLSGPTLTALGGPGPTFIKRNSNPEAGSAVRAGLMPPVRPLFDAQIRDTQITRGHDGRYYLTGSSGDDIWRMNDGVELWVSDDLTDWDYLGLVWSFEKDATWQRAWRDHNGPVRALWAPEIHYVKGNYFITLSMPPGDRGLLKSVTGRPEGPYVNALADDGKWDGNIDATLFEDDDGTVYVLWGEGWIARMKDDMSGFDEEPRKLVVANPDTVASHHARTCLPRRQGADVGHEGVSMFKRDGIYYLTAADTYEGRYSSCAATATSVYGPYRDRYEAVPCGGGTGYLRQPAHKDADGRDIPERWWCSIFGNDSQAPFREMPGLIMVDFTADGHIIPAREQPMLDTAERIRWAARWDRVWKDRY